MKQVFQDLKDGATRVEEVPAPASRPGHLLVRTNSSVISAGTERMLVEFGRANVLTKARQHPERVRHVLDKMATDGIRPTIDAVKAKLSEPVALGYTAAGEVIDVGKGVRSFKVGDRVATNGPHAEIVSVPANLCAGIPGDHVAFEQAAFTPLAAVALQGLRLAEPTIGERFVVTGLGLIGQLAVQLLRVQGCQVLGIDHRKERLQLAERFGAAPVDLSAGEDPVAAAEAFTGGAGVDGVIIAATTSSNDPIRQAAEMCRKRGRIVLVGVVGLELERQQFYEKELRFQVSCSYGPGRYDPDYEGGGQDYPQGFVRWTAGRNFEAVLGLMAQGRLDVASLTTSHHELADAATAYKELSEPSAIGVLLRYPRVSGVTESRTVTTSSTSRPMPIQRANGVVGVIGAGNYAQRVLLPALAKTDARLAVVASRGGSDAARAAKRFRFERATTDIDSLFDDESIDTLIVATRHDTHAALTVRGLEAGKHVFVEKPLALALQDVDQIRRVVADHPNRILCVGFNRRFSPLTATMKRLLSMVSQPKTLIATVNAGRVPDDHWTQDLDIGGGRIVGEACHFIDLLRHLANNPVQHVHSSYLDTSTNDTASIQMTFEDGSIATVHYVATGSRRFPKERVEAFVQGRVLQLDNFRALRGFGWPDFKREKLRSQEKGHASCLSAFIQAVQAGGPPPIPVDELLEVSALTLHAAQR
ncbi:MAG: bi-domain-containing oxidoreductase [Actinobacteria bacterium]|nr:bi-domain-containing oxidoreductase [Actinomycetota bacterium]